MDFGPHALFIWASYGIAGLVVLALIAWLLLDRRTLLRKLEGTEARGDERATDHGAVE